MPRLYKIVLFGFMAYVIATASPDHQARMAGGLLAIKDAAVDACTREGSLCTSAISGLVALAGNTLNENAAPWLDEQSKRVEPPLHRVQPPGGTS